MRTIVLLLFGIFIAQYTVGQITFKDFGKVYPDVEYVNRSKVLDVLQQAALNGKNAMYQAEHIENINDMLGKNRIFD